MICSEVIFLRRKDLWPEHVCNDSPTPERVTEEPDQMWNQATPEHVVQIHRAITSAHQEPRTSIYFEHLKSSRPLRGQKGNQGENRTYENLENFKSQRSHEL